VSVTEVPFEIPGADGRPIRGEALVPASSKASIVLCHGLKGFARGGFFPLLRRRLAAARFTVVTFDFSGSGIGCDRENFTQLDAFAADSFSKQLFDVDAVWREGEHRGWLGRSSGLFGFSRGGGIAVLYAARNASVRALVTWSAISSVDRWTPEVRAEWRARGYSEIENSRTKQIMRVGTEILDDIEMNRSATLDIAAAAARIDAPWLIVHGTADETVNVDEARRLFEASRRHAELALIEGASHTYNSSHGVVEAPRVLETAIERTLEFFDGHLAER
jgi:pimeloyl-ACP methyl ester carboxylesterase